MKKNIIFLLLLLLTIKIDAQTDEFFEKKTSIGGYGELHFNHETAPNGIVKQTLDFHRFVLFFGYAWNEKWSFKSEIELEHNFVQGGQGELELEQAYVNYHYADWLGFQIGVILPSIGLINEFHEPPLFFGVERPEYHNKIIPTTWYGNGLSFYGRYSGFDYKLSIMEGLNSEKFSESSAIRGGRRKGFLANAKSLLYNFRVDYYPTTGLKVGGSYTYNKASGDTSSNAINLFEVHASYNQNNLFSVFEYGRIDYEKYNLEQSVGYYFDLGYNVASLLRWETQVIPFIRYTNYNTAFQTKSGGDSEKKNHYKYFMIGVSVKPFDQVVFKADYGKRVRGFGGEETTLFNFGVGYMF